MFKKGKVVFAALSHVTFEETSHFQTRHYLPESRDLLSVEHRFV